MTDVRLTIVAEDGQVYPVLGNTKGELKLEEPTVNSDDYVAKSGDNMTGNLTLGTDKITLDATNGGATFAGTIQTGETNANSSTGSWIQDLGGVYTTRPAGSSAPAFAAYQQGNAASPKAVINADGSATFAREVVAGVRDVNSVLMTSSGTIQGVVSGESRYSLTGDGRATFTNDVVIGSRNKKWMIVESNGIAHLVEQTRVSVSADVPAAQYPPLRNIPEELDLIEQALGEVMHKLRMNPPAGWPVWDGSDENL